MFNRIVVGVDESAPAQVALRWAVREAIRRGAGLRVVTAWPPTGAQAGGPRPAAGEPHPEHVEVQVDHNGVAEDQRGARPGRGGPAAVAASANASADEWMRRSRTQREQIAAARAAVAPDAPLTVVREISERDPVFTLCYAAGSADLVVVGSAGRTLAEESLSGRLSLASRARRLVRSCPLVVVPAPEALESAAAGTARAAGRKPAGRPPAR